MCDVLVFIKFGSWLVFIAWTTGWWIKSLIAGEGFLLLLWCFD